VARRVVILKTCKGGRESGRKKKPDGLAPAGNLAPGLGRTPGRGATQAQPGGLHHLEQGLRLHPGSLPGRGLGNGEGVRGERQGLLKRLDYSTNKDAAREYIKKYHLSIPPSLLFLDAQGNLIWRADGELDYDLVLAKLKEFGA
jgi:hypothetical protein